MEDAVTNFFVNGNAWVRADFHLHTKADKEFKYDGEDNSLPLFNFLWFKFQASYSPANP